MNPTQAQIEAEKILGHLKALYVADDDPKHDPFAIQIIATALTAAAEAGEQTDLEANRLYRYLNGLDQDSHDSRAEHIMCQSLDGLTIGPNNRNSTKEILANHFEAVEATTIERCAKVAEQFFNDPDGYRKSINAIRALKEEP